MLNGLRLFQDVISSKNVLSAAILKYLLYIELKIKSNSLSGTFNYYSFCSNRDLMLERLKK